MGDYWTRSFEGLILYNIGSSCVVQVKETEARRVEVAYLSKAMWVPKKASLGLKQRLYGIDLSAAPPNNNSFT